MQDITKFIVPDTFLHSSAIGIYGKRESGKTTLIRKLLSTNQSCSPPTIFVTAPLHLAGYDGINASIINNYSPEVTETCLGSESVIVFDDCLNYSTSPYRKVIATFSERKEKGIIVAGQTCEYLPSSCEFDYLFIFNNPTVVERAHLFGTFIKDYTDISQYDEFVSLLDEVCKDNRALVVDRATRKLFWYRA